MTKIMDEYRIANAFEQAAVSVMLMDPAGFTTEEYNQIKTAIRKAEKENKNGRD
ncbi:hypothetical protein LOB94_03610 [Lactobacillus delbrueckii subsp. bulgaricus]|uniref:hypothetical protein n=1 Tax=Lactobacillus delbrueckii TaxID=1584 RepID=UPI000AC406FC|nr:hypothetical protein [Lactobacillus delbrueckii]MCD5464878.1 hypothetical protein [Lactobacillus delbrueckii subsp. bulgaricus]MCD5482385.1 hypothetical protein [Lactobacillus delbrueckii subsp. bulgaricus]MCD5482437.1 hypothetical protein [Lactobacillus delbrueckii subsp. bulgaricus]